MSNSSLLGRPTLAVLLGLVLAAGPGCGGTKGSSEYTAGGVKVKVLHPPGGSTSRGKIEGDSSETVFTWGDPKRKPLTVIVGHRRLKIDGRDYGELKAGDEVVIDARQDDPRVTVGGAVRKPAEQDTTGEAGPPPAR